MRAKANFAMIGLVTGGVLNIVLDPILMFGLSLGTAGAGIATALSQSISFCILLSMFLRGKTVSQFRITAVTREAWEFGMILVGGAPSLAVRPAEHRRHAAEHCRPQLWRCRCGRHEHRFPHFHVHHLGSHWRWGGLQPVAAFNYGARKFRRYKKLQFLPWVQPFVCWWCW